MRSETFCYLAQKVVDEFDGCEWKDDKSAIYSAKYLGEIEKSFLNMGRLEEQVQKLVEETHSKIKFY